MKTETKEVKTFVTRLYCDCGKEMKVAQQWADSQMRYRYRCPVCLTCSEIMTVRYPAIEYREISDET